MPGTARLGRAAHWVRRASELPGAPAPASSRPRPVVEAGGEVGAALCAAPRRAVGNGVVFERCGGAGSRTDGHVPPGAKPAAATTRLRRKSWCLRFERAHDGLDALLPRVGTPGVTRHCQRFGRPSPFHPLFEDRARYAGNSEIQHPWGLAFDGETRTRTGDTAIFSRVLYQLSYSPARGKASACRAPRVAEKYG